MDRNEFPSRPLINKAFTGFIKRYLNFYNQSPYTRAYFESLPVESTKGLSFKEMVIEDILDLVGKFSYNTPENEWPVELVTQLLYEKSYKDGEELDPFELLDEKVSQIEDEITNSQNNKYRVAAPMHWNHLVAAYEDKPEARSEINALKNSWDGFMAVLSKINTSFGHENTASVHNISMRALNTIFSDAVENAMGDSPEALPTLQTKASKKSTKSTTTSDEMDFETPDEELRFYFEKMKDSLPPHVVTKFEKELEKLEASDPDDGNYRKTADYLENILDLPWNEYLDLEKDISKVEESLNESHYGLDKVKEQIVRHVAVQNRVGPDARQKIICLAGPPGVGKTSIAKGIAEATGREFLRLSLGGVNHESAIRGHGRTYQGSEPGKIIRSLQSVSSANVLFNLDEIDKIGKDSANGDPSAAMLEVLDPEQNKAFVDHYIDLGYDLSKVMFICTANDINEIPGPLRDRMEIIDIEGYVFEEKFQIAKRYLVDQAMKDKGLDGDTFSIDDDVLKELISSYAKREAGVRNLKRTIENLCEKAVYDIEVGQSKAVHVTMENLEDLIGPPNRDVEAIAEENEVGVGNGLAFTTLGGVPLTIESVMTTDRSSGAKITGRLGQVMQESKEVATGLIKSMAYKGVISEKTADKINFLQLHAPQGAVPKDGPSAGIALTTAIISAITGIAVNREVAMTGEINLRGKVGAIGGLRYKLEAALEAGYKTVLIPEDNVKDLNNVPEGIKDKLDIQPVSTIQDVLEIALIQPLPAPEQDNDPATPEVAADFEQAGDEGTPPQAPGNDQQARPASGQIVPVFEDPGMETFSFKL